jgi:hypothetical protein
MSNTPEEQISVVVFEGGKTEYREILTLSDHPDPAVRQSAEGIRVYTPGKDKVSPFRLNPLQAPQGTALDSHVDGVVGRLEAAQPMPGPLRPIVQEAIHDVHSAHPDPDNPPIMSELLPAAETVLLRKGYSPPVYADLRGALDVRLGQFTRGTIGRIFSCPWDSPSTDELIHSRSIIELAALSVNALAFLLLCILAKIRAAVDAAGSSRKRLRLEIFIEEAHRVFGRSSSPVLSEGIADPKGHASEALITNMAEGRALGVGFTIIDSMPSLLPPEIHKNMATRIVFGLTSSDDRQELGAHALLDPVQVEELGRLRPGEAFFLTEGFARPSRIRTVDIREELGLTDPPSDAELRGLLETKKWFHEKARSRAAMELQQVARELDKCDAQRMGLLRDAAEIEERVVKCAASSQGKKELARLGRLARNLAMRMDEMIRRLERGVCWGLLTDVPDPSPADPAISAARQTLKKRYEHLTRVDVARFKVVMTGLVRRCAQASES